jgi:hypothetical protein
VRELIIFIRPKLVKDMGAAELIARQKKTPGAVGADVVSYFETGHFPGQIPAETAATNATVDVKGANDGE